jgi:hypothetical protein
MTQTATQTRQTTGDQDTDTGGDLISLGQAAKITPQPVDPGTVARWIRHGLRTADGSIVRLRSKQMGVRLYTSATWLDQFAADLAFGNQQRREDEPTPPTETALSAMDQLEARGL